MSRHGSRRASEEEERGRERTLGLKENFLSYICFFPGVLLNKIDLFSLPSLMLFFPE